MKTKQLLSVLFAYLLILPGCTNNRGIVERPAFIARNTDALEISKVELSDTAAMLYIKAFYPPKSWIQIDSFSFLTDNQGKKYTIRTVDGIALGKQFTMPDSGKVEFTMIFPPVASNAVSVDFSEGDVNGAWKIWGIQLTNQPLKVNFPKGLTENIIDKSAILPPVEFKTGKAHIEGQILNYCSGMPAEVSASVTYPFTGYSPVEISFPVDGKGKFSGEIDAFSVHTAIIYWQNCVVKCFIAPGETTSLVLNPTEASRRQSRFSGNSPSFGEPVYYGGYLASLSKELANTQPLLSLQFYTDYESYQSFLQSIGTKTPETLKTFFLDERQAKKAIIDTLNVSPACKQILSCATDLFYADAIVNVPSLLDRSYISNHQLQGDKEAVDKYLATRKFNLSNNFYDVLKNFSMLNDPQMLYAGETVEYADEWQTQNMQPVLSKALTTDQGTLFDIMKIAGAYNDIENFKPVSEAQIKELLPVYQEYIKNKNDKLLQVIEANKKKTGFTVNDIEKVTNKDVFPFILSKFKGKSILLDFWATWCAPCRTANEEMKPVKEELADKDIVYVYVAGENSPLEVWKNMITDLHGEHFRLSDKQWYYMRDTFGIDGVPTYFFIDREGNIKDKQVGYPGVQAMKEKLLQLVNE